VTACPNKKQDPMMTFMMSSSPQARGSLFRSKTKPLFQLHHTARDYIFNAAIRMRL
jgi:hypothetical protein